jgi:hypothetical protein
MSTTKSTPGSVRSQRDLAWIGRYSDLVRFVARSERLPSEVAKPVDGVEEDERRLGGWVRYQRRRNDRGLIPAWQRELLDGLPGFTWDPLGDQWDGWMELLRDFLDREQRIPRYRSKDAGERALAAWVHKQRHIYGKGALPPSRVTAMRSLSFKIL